MEIDEILDEMVTVEIAEVLMNMVVVLTLKVEVMTMDETKGQDQSNEAI